MTRPSRDELRAGRTGPSWTDVQDWVPLSGISPPAIGLYVLLRMHVNHSRGTNEAWPGKERLALMMKRSRGDAIDPELKELVALGAVDVERVKTVPARNIYTVHSLPPDGYAGPLNLAEWALIHDAEVEQRKAAAAARTDRSRKKTGAGEVAKPQVTAVTGPGRLLAEGAPVTGSERLLVTGPGRLEPTEGEPTELSPLTPPTPAPAPRTVPAQTRGGESTEYDRLTAAIRAARARRGWSTVAITRAVKQATGDGRSADQVIAVLGRLVDDPDTQSPARLAHVPADWWEPVRTAASKPDWCGEPNCDPSTRRLTDNDPDSKADLGRCHRCHPLSQPASAA